MQVEENAVKGAPCYYLISTKITVIMSTDGFTLYNITEVRLWLQWLKLAAWFDQFLFQINILTSALSTWSEPSAPVEGAKSQTIL